jgi:hypothetical protein
MRLLRAKTCARAEAGKKMLTEGPTLRHRVNLCYVEVFNTTLSRTFRSRNVRTGRCTPATRMPTARWVACARCRRRCAAEPEGVARGRCLSPQFLNSESQSSLKSLRAEDSRYQKSRYETGQSFGATTFSLSS